MRTIRIRTFTMLSLLLILLVPWIFFVAANVMVTKSLSLGENQPQDLKLQKQLTETIRLIETGSDHWMEPNWQNRLHNQLRQANLDAAILDAANQDIYRSNPDRNGALLKTERFSVIEDGRVLGKIVIYLPNSNAIPMIAALAGLLLAFFIVGVEMRRFILKPLERMSVTARQIASGDWDVRLPSSRMTEIAEVRDSFKVMVNGLQKSNRKQVELEEERRFVIAAVAHDLRTPLFALRGYLDGIEQGIAQSPERLAKYLAVCKEKSAQLDRLVEDLFTFTKIEYLETELNKNKIDLKLILQKALDSLNPVAEQKHISLIMDRAADDFAIIGDPHLLERAVNNLLDNAVRHTPLHGEILVQCYKEDNKVFLRFGIRGPVSLQRNSNAYSNPCIAVKYREIVQREERD